MNPVPLVKALSGSPALVQPALPAATAQIANKLLKKMLLTCVIRCHPVIKKWHKILSGVNTCN